MRAALGPCPATRRGLRAQIRRNAQSRR